MIASNRNRATIGFWIGFGLGVGVIAFSLARGNEEFSDWEAGVFVLAWIAISYASFQYAIAKGHPWWKGVYGVFVVGLLVLLRLPDLTEERVTTRSRE